MVCNRKCSVKNAKPYFLMTSLQFGYSIMFILSAICLKNGMNHFVLSVYRQIFAAIAITPFALVFERKTRPKMTRSIFWKILVLAFLEPVLDSNLYLMGLNYTSSTFTSAMTNTLPAISFIMATIFRLEKVNIRKIGSQAKIVGTIVTVSGAMLVSLYKGPIVNIFGVHEPPHHTGGPAAVSASTPQHWILGALFLVACCTGWSLFFVLQSYTLKEYPAELSLTAWICVMGALEGASVSLVSVRDVKSWALGWDTRLLTSVYMGVVCTGGAYYVQGIVNKERGPVFVTVFSPLCLIFTAVLSSIFLHELLHLGSILGSVMIVAGLYTVIWGKSKDQSNSKASTTTQELPIVNDFTTTLPSTNIDSLNNQGMEEKS